MRERKALRTEFMLWLYEATQGNLFAVIDAGEFKGSSDPIRSDIESAIKMLEGQGLIDAVWVGGLALPHVRILFEGVTEVEESLSHRDNPTENLGAINSINYTYVHGDLTTTQYQQGTNNSTQIIESTSDNMNLAREILLSLRGGLGSLELSEALAKEVSLDLDFISAELLKEEPRLPVLHTIFGSIRNILEGVSANLAVQAILNMKWPIFS